MWIWHELRIAILFNMNKFQHKGMKHALIFCKQPIKITAIVELYNLINSLENSTHIDIKT